MGLFDFVKDAGESVLDFLTPGRAHADDLKKHIENVGLGNPNVQISVEGDRKVVVSGQVASQEEKEKILLALGNIKGIEQVDDQITVGGGGSGSGGSGGGTPEPQPRFVTVKSGDTLGGIARAVYGDAGQFQKIFKANQPMLKSPDRIYPGQVLRIPD
ncbi:peptidoglycan-binding protein LysM [Pseudomonas sp. DTU_2021_1001937_2_SI_NGA_ILE_001]|uniref:peptidoglycan-binding protein LysM n=1 Tax=Pseudomonas sp. DTU_2021_1001937_2_SI_NGA_ILE_001 TaxID=3077589 RepID=UPI0028FC1E64|nr:peptidoglycan-binding protein LysM [Pseudomonas sp. DTU_2021_1001937_2_SI_NGA_ILE_001]WNW12444.1 peptidoglycan-binding protein LysM [Pseudomonas sp. DTU_2021_1001937_2_SI_NGA_ILE_001]